MLCRWQRVLLAWMLLVLLAPPVPTARAQGPQGALTIHTDAEMLGVPTLRGGGHITWTLTGPVAVELRRKVLAMFDEYPSVPPGFPWAGVASPANRDGVLSAAETKAFTDMLEAEIEGQRQALGGTRWRYLLIERTDLFERDLPVDRSADGLVGRDRTSQDSIEIRFIFDGRTVSENFPFAPASRALADGLYSMFELRQSESLDDTAPRVWPLQLMNGWHLVRLPGDGRNALWAGNASGNADPLNGTYDNGLSSATVTTTAVGVDWTDLRFATTANVTFGYMGRGADAGDTLRLQVAPGPAFSTWTDLTNDAGQVSLPGTASYAWRSASYNLSAYIGQQVRLRLLFTSDGSGNAAPGFFVRDFAIAAPSRYVGELVLSDIDYMVGTIDFQDVSAVPGHLHIIRTPVGEVLMYNAAFDVSTMNADAATFRSFLWYENPQFLFVVLIIAGYAISRVQDHTYRSYRSRHPREYRAAASPTRWLHWVGRIAITVLVLFYLFPTGLAILGSSTVVAGIPLIALSAAAGVGVGAGSWLFYRFQGKLIPPETGVAGTADGDLEPPPPEGISTSASCSHCLQPLGSTLDTLVCTCGLSYHRGCADVLVTCSTCGRTLAEKSKQKAPATCRTCGEVQLVDPDQNLFTAVCSVCGTTLELPEAGYNYLVLSSDPAPVYIWFGRLCKNGSKGLALSTVFPDKLRKDHGIDAAEILWLSDTSPGPTTFDPRRLEFEIMRALMAFIRTNPGGSLVIDGVEHLIVENTLDKVVRFAKRLNDLASVNRVTLFVPVAPGSVGGEDLALLQQAFDRTIDLTD